MRSKIILVMVSWVVCVSATVHYSGITTGISFTLFALYGVHVGYILFGERKTYNIRIVVNPKEEEDNA